MKIDEHKAIIEQLRTCTDDATRSKLLLDLTTDYANLSNDLETRIQTETTLKKENEDFRTVNNSLWLQVNAQTSNTKHEDSANNEHEEHAKQLSFDSLKF